MSLLVPTRRTDEEIVLQARKNIHELERWGRWLAVLRIATAIGIAILIGWGISGLFGLLNLAAGNRAEFSIGFIVGFFGGAITYKLGFHLTLWHMSMLPDERDRLLVKYDDALSELLNNPGKVLESAG